VSALADLQRQFQAYVLEGSAAVGPRIESGPRGNVTPRLAIYGDGYRIRLVDALRNDFETLAAHLGEAAFAEICTAYVVATPSPFRNIRWYGSAFPDFLRAILPWSERPWLAELAGFDWALGIAFDADDAPHVRFEDLVRLPPEAWSDLRFGFHPSLRRLELATNAPALRNAVDAGETLPDAELFAEPVQWVIWRQGLSTRFRSLHPAEASALDAGLAGGSFTEICAGVGDWLEPAEASSQAAVWLRDWVEAELIERVASASTDAVTC